ncbi:hypothetical protein EMPS_03606 [Entomortierella parvispora]|uniref:Uncharacterized protein n=1 Tax=Entomortierella parvispora TaxID=205924 RepID=A0A9P3H6Z5_9FUNG|nr:hypothetical protein EMPS_03606 [Entomortierella parvispora]
MTNNISMDPAKRKRDSNSLEPVISTPKNDAGPGIAPEMSTMVNLLASSVQGMQGSLGNAYQSMANQLKQSMEMTHTMSNMMEMFLVSSLSVCSRIERDGRSEKPLLIITTENKSQFPIPNVSGTLRMGRIDEEDNTFTQSFDSNANLKSSTLIPAKKGVKDTTKREHSIYWAEEDSPPKDISLDVLLPGSKLVDVFSLDLDSFDEWVILIEASFKSPGTGKKLFKKHECCVYLIDQCKIELYWSLDTIPRDEYQQSVQPRMMIKSFREVFHVPVVDGVKVGMRFVLSPSGMYASVIGKVIDILEDDQVLQLDLWLDENDDDIDLDRIGSELMVLGGAYPSLKQ